MRQLLLASASPRRAELLEQIGVPFSRLPGPDIDESPWPDELPDSYVERMSTQKAEACSRYLDASNAILAADTCVVLGSLILGKPQTAQQAMEMLGQLSGATHEVLTAVSLVWREGGTNRLDTCLSRSSVTFRSLPASLIARYVATGEPMDKAGAYGIQGKGGVLVSRLEGSYSGVMGLPVQETWLLLQRAGIEGWCADLDQQVRQSGERRE